MKNKKRIPAILTAVILALSPAVSPYQILAAETGTENMADYDLTEEQNLLSDENTEGYDSLAETSEENTDSSDEEAAAVSRPGQDAEEQKETQTNDTVTNEADSRTADDSNQSQTAAYERQMILIGDSRTVYMHEAVGDDGQIWSCKGGIGEVWMKAVGVPAVEKYISSDTNVVILMGINDAWEQTVDAMTTTYADYLNQKSGEWTKKGANVFFVSVNPVRGDWGNSTLMLTNDSIDLFNSEMRAKLNYNVHFIDTNSKIRETEEFNDALHYTTETNREIYELIKAECAKYKTDQKNDSRTTGDFSNYFYTSNADEQNTETVNMYRLYNPNSGEHFYTKNAVEKEYLVEAGWNDEGVGWKAPVTSRTPVYRVYNPNSGLHHYTMNKGERDSLVALGWNDEGIGWYSDDCRRNIVYREYNPNSGQHNYASGRLEHGYLISLGWKDESYGWFSA